jgi:hypothetical protein
MLPEPAPKFELTVLETSDIIYLELAMTAVKYVKGKIKAGSANRGEDYARRKKNKMQPLYQGTLDAQRVAQRSKLELQKQPQWIGSGWMTPEVLDMHDEMCFLGEQAEFTGFGNCGEQAAVAYKFLSQYPISGLTIINLMGGNHEFVVLGAGPNVIEDAICRSDKAHNFFGPHAVICDPWLGGGMCFTVSTQWEKAFAQMMAEAAPTADPEAVLIKCITRHMHRHRSTKVASWQPPK